MSLTRANRTVLNSNVPTWNRFREGGYVVKDNDFFIDNNNVLFSYIGNKPHYVTAGTSPDEDGGIWSLDNKDGKWKHVINGSSVLGSVNSTSSLQLITPSLGDIITLNGETDGLFIAVKEGSYVHDGGYIVSSASQGIVWKRLTDVCTTDNLNITSQTQDAGSILNLALKNTDTIKLTSDIHISSPIQLNDGNIIDLNGYTLFAHSNVFDANNSSGVIIKDGTFESDGSFRLAFGITKGITIKNVYLKKGALAITFVGNYNNRNENITIEDCTHDGRLGGGVMGGFFSVDYGNNVKVTRCVGLGGTEFIDINNFCTNVEISYNKITGVYKENVFDVNSAQHVHIHHNVVSLLSLPTKARPVWISSYSGSSWPEQADPYYRHSDHIVMEHNIFSIDGDFNSDYIIIINSGTGDQPVPQGRVLHYNISNNIISCSNMSLSNNKVLIGVIDKYDIKFFNNKLHNVLVTLQGATIEGGYNYYSNSNDTQITALHLRNFVGHMYNDVYSNYSPQPSDVPTCGVVQINNCPDITLQGFRFKGKTQGYGVVSGNGSTKPKVLDFTTDMELTSVSGVRLAGDAILRRL